MIKQATLSLVLVLGACATDASSDRDPPLVDDGGGKADGYAGPRAVNCYTTAPAGTLVKLTLTPNGDTFDIAAASKAGPMFALASQRPSLNAYVENGTSDTPNEFVDFRPSGLDVVPPTASPRLELALAVGPKALLYADATSELQLECTVSATRLLDFLAIAPVDGRDAASGAVVGFDIDDTLLFSTPAFTRGFATGGTPAPSDTTFWTAVNGCDPGCAAETITRPDGTTRDLPANDASGVKASALELVQYHLALGHDVYAITARPEINGDPLRDYLVAQFGLARDHIFFEPTNKTDRMAMLGLDVFYGDSDSDITDARKVAGKPVVGVRFLRSPRSSNRSGDRLAKYHPGYYGEAIVAGSYD